MPGLGSGYSKAGAVQQRAVGASVPHTQLGTNSWGPKAWQLCLRTCRVGLQTSGAAKITRGCEGFGQRAQTENGSFGRQGSGEREGEIPGSFSCSQLSLCSGKDSCCLQWTLAPRYTQSRGNLFLVLTKVLVKKKRLERQLLPV